jgi:hypothetical protein
LEDSVRQHRKFAANQPVIIVTPSLLLVDVL